MANLMATVGRFNIYADGAITGPAAFVKRPGFISRTQATVSLLAVHAPAGQSVWTLIGVAAQTDYAVWQGAQDIARRG